MPISIQPAMLKFKDSNGEYRNADCLKGDKGDQGETGQTGATGADGVSPTVSVSEITGGHQVTITDGTGNHSFNVMDGEPDPTDIASAVTDWMDTNIHEDPTVVIDASLNTSGAAADAKAAGDEIRELKSAIADLDSAVFDTERIENTIASSRTVLDSKINKTTGIFESANGHQIDIYDIDDLDSVYIYSSFTTGEGYAYYSDSVALASIGSDGTGFNSFVTKIEPNTDAEFLIYSFPSGVKWLALCHRKSGGGNTKAYTVTIKKDSKLEEIENDIQEQIDGLVDDIKAIDNKTNEIPNKIPYTDVEVGNVSPPNANIEFTSKVMAEGSKLGDICDIFRSAILTSEYMKTAHRIGTTKPGSTTNYNYAHCPSIEIKGTKAYISAFQRTEATVDSYIFDDASSQLFIVDCDTLEQEDSIAIAEHGDTVDNSNITFATGSGACQAVFVSENTLRCVFVALLSDGLWHQCYRDYNVQSGQMSGINFCKIIDENNVSHDFTTQAAADYIQSMDYNSEPVDLSDWSTLTDAQKTSRIVNKPNTNIVCQPTKIGDKWLVACGCLNKWADMPILETEDWINFKYWATPSYPGGTENHAKFEMALTSGTQGSVTYIYSATRQEIKGTLRVMKINSGNTDQTQKGVVTQCVDIPDANPSRPFILKDGSGNLIISHILTSARLEGSALTVVNRNSFAYKGYADLPPMVYPSFAEYGNNLIVTMMIPYALYICKLPKLTSLPTQFRIVEAIAKYAELSFSN